MKNIMFICCILIATNLICFGQNGSSNYNIANRFSVEGDGGWDYLTVDESSSRIFISHGLVTQVIDTKNGKLLGTINDTKGVHGIALDKEDNKAFISCGRDSSVSVINLTTLELISKIKVTGANPDAILYDKFSDKVFVFNGRSSNTTVIDAKTNTVVATILLLGKPEFSVSDEKGKIFVNIEDKSLVSVINSKTLKVENNWLLAPGEEPSGLALDTKTHRLFSVCSNKKLIVMNALDGKIISTLDIGEGTDGCAFDPKLNRAYSSNGDGTVTVIQGKKKDKYHVLETIQTSKGARTICLNSNTHHIYLPTAEFEPAIKPTAEKPHPRPSIKPGTFTIIDISPK